MGLSTFRRTTSIAIAAALISCAAASQLAAASTVTYTASGTFASTPVSGTDLFKLAGQPFSITVTASESQKPSKSGKTYAAYSKLKMTGTVMSGLLPTPITLSSSGTSIELVVNSKGDMFVMFVPLKIAGLQFQILAKINMPAGTITSTAIGPFKGPVTVTPTAATVTYTANSASTTLGINGTLSTTVQ